MIEDTGHVLIRWRPLHTGIHRTLDMDPVFLWGVRWVVPLKVPRGCRINGAWSQNVELLELEFKTITPKMHGNMKYICQYCLTKKQKMLITSSLRMSSN